VAEPVLLPRPRSLVIAPGAEPPSSGPLPAQGYRLVVRGGDVVAVEAADDSGRFYAEQTLTQLRRQLGVALPDLAVEDWPDLPVRGVMLDISRDKVPTLETLFELVTRLASWKVNHVQLYMEHTFAYAGHEEVWADASPLTADEVRALDAHCRSLHVELTPNQNCLGHMERWLRHDRYKPLAISPDGWTDGRGRLRPPTTIDPAKPESLALVADLLSQLLPSFAGSDRVHVGLDEPWELPDERFGDYLEHIRRVRTLPELDGREMLIWGDIVASHPEALGQLPAGVTVCDWGYEAVWPFAERADHLAAAGLPFWICSGTSSWNSLVGRFSNARTNIVDAADVAVSRGASGYLVTDWGDNGHLQPLPVSEPGFAMAAAASWCLDANRDLDVGAALSAHSFDDPAGELAAALLSLGDAHTLVAPQVPNMSVLVMHLYWPQLRVGEGFTEGLTVEALDEVAAAISTAVSRLDRARPGRVDGALVVEELRWAAALLSVLVADGHARLQAGRTLGSVPASVRADLAARLEPLLDEHRRIWLTRNRPVGLDDSAARVHGLLEAYRSPPA
jgi:hexosaminidase